jgi:hypothetical protein
MIYLLWELQRTSKRIKATTKTTKKAKQEKVVI